MNPGCLLASLLLLLTLAGGCASPLTQVIVVRHAEKADTSADPDLSPAGQARAQALAHAAGKAGVQAIFVTQLRRTRQTAQPLAQQIGLPMVQVAASDTAGLVQRILTRHAGQVVLVVAHSNTIPQIISALGGPAIEDIGEGDYDNLFIVLRHRKGPARLLHLRYGRPS